MHNLEKKIKARCQVGKKAILKKEKTNKYVEKKERKKS